MKQNSAQQSGVGQGRLSLRWRAWLPTVLVLGFFALLSFAYFSPAVLEGRDLFQHDVAGASGTAQDVRDYYDETGETSYWTNSLFGGMPMYQIAPTYPSLRIIKTIQDVLTLQSPLKLLPSYSWLLFAMLWGFYLFMRSLRQGRGLSLLGALMWCFSTYFIILIDAGHIWKLMVLSFIPPTIAGLIHTYEGRYLRGGIMTAFFAALQLMSNHVQMSYYFAFVMLFIVLSYLYQAIREKKYKHFALSSLTTLAAAIIAIAINGSNIYHTYEYTQETMRGGSALGTASGSEGKKGGLDKAYITAWSYGKAETLTFLVPNVYGGASGYLADKPEVLEQIKQDDLRQMLAGMNQYWGDQPFTSGPVYVGAFVLFLAILAIFIVRMPFKWALLSATILSLLLGWGHNLMWFSDWFIDYFPLYNKFRTVSSILVIAEFTIPTLAVLAFVKFLDDPQKILQKERSALGISLALTLGLAFLLALVPSMFFDFMSRQESEMFRQYLGDPRASQLLTALKEVRAGIVSADAWRSLIVIVAGLVVCFLYLRDIISRKATIALIIFVVLGDLWFVNKRYLNDEKFIDLSEIQARANPVTDIDRQIKEDKDPHYRVLNLSVSPFNDATTSYSHRSIGGYHAAKLSRYQDLIEKQISEQNKQVLDMLDMRYLISRNEQNQLSVQRNLDAMGPAWLIGLGQVQIVSTADEEMEALKELDLRRQAVLNRDQGLKLDHLFGDLDDTSPLPDSLINPSLGEVKLSKYTPNQIVYDVVAQDEALLVMSEIYYPKGWHLSIDGKPAEIKRANYLLRAVVLPKGQHRVEMKFDPSTIHTTERLSWIAQILLLGALTLWGILSIKKYRNNKA